MFGKKAHSKYEMCNTNCHATKRKLTFAFMIMYVSHGDLYHHDGGGDVLVIGGEGEALLV